MVVVVVVGPCWKRRLKKCAQELGMKDGPAKGFNKHLVGIDGGELTKPEPDQSELADGPRLKRETNEEKFTRIRKK